MIPKGMEIVDKNSWVLNYFGHIICICWRILFHRSLDSTEKSSELAVGDFHNGIGLCMNKRYEHNCLL